MSELEPLPEFFVTDERQRIAQPTYELLAQCQVVMASAETGLTGPTLMEAGEIITTDATPNHQWYPLNRAAGERFEAWLASLPTQGASLTQAEISEAAYAMRPREGEPELPHDQWWPAVLKYAAAMKEKRMTGQMRVPQPATQHRPGGRAQPVMPFVAHGAAMPADPSRPPPSEGPTKQVAPDAPRRARGRPAAMANAGVSDSPVSTST